MPLKIAEDCRMPAKRGGFCEPGPPRQSRDSYSRIYGSLHGCVGASEKMREKMPRKTHLRRKIPHAVKTSLGRTIALLGLGLILPFLLLFVRQQLLLFRMFLLHLLRLPLMLLLN